MIESTAAIESINSAIEQNDSKEWKQNAIKLKGMSNNMRINNLTNDLSTIINTSDAEEVKNALNKIKISLADISKIGG